MSGKPDLSAATTSRHNKMMGAIDISLNGLSKEDALLLFKEHHEEKKEKWLGISTLGAAPTLGVALFTLCAVTTATIIAPIITAGSIAATIYNSAKTYNHKVKAADDYKVEDKDLSKFIKNENLSKEDLKNLPTPDKPDLLSATASGHNKMMGATEVSLNNISKDDAIKLFKENQKQKRKIWKRASTVASVSMLVAATFTLCLVSAGTLSLIPSISSIVLRTTGFAVNRYSISKSKQHEENSHRGHKVEDKDLAKFAKKNKLQLNV